MKPEMKSRRTKPGPKPGTVNPRAHGAGRKKGTPNTMTKDVKEALILGVSRAGGRNGLVGYFEKLAKKKPEVAAGLLGKLIPQAHPQTDSSLTAAFIKLLSKQADTRTIDVTPRQNRIEDKTNE